jgi:pyruvate/2-oxoglutarate/acetoin dehydrogenase E1 component
MIPFGKAKLVQEGTTLTIVTYGSLVHRAVQALKPWSRKGFSRRYSICALSILTTGN